VEVRPIIELPDLPQASGRESSSREVTVTP
jgi:hypothetical protein